MLKIAVYGKGGIGKSTTTANVSAALADMGLSVMQIGCDPKADSTSGLTGGHGITTVLDAIRGSAGEVTLNQIVARGYKNILCVEAGGPTPGVGCAGRGIITAFEKLEELGAYELCKPDVILYDVLGDVVCGGFAMPIRGGYARKIFIVTSGEKMAIYAAANIAMAVSNFKSRGYAELSGLIVNSRNTPDEMERVGELASDIGAPVTKVIPRSDWVQKAEATGRTVVEAFPDCEMASCYRDLAGKMLEVCGYERERTA
ncbi:MAG: AAA family ATPase [Synergistaceae bacterium]|nr:AAA family ATPase [Synergistaceae bacterium]